MISPGELAPGQWFTLREKAQDPDAASAARWSAVEVAAGPSQHYSTTSLFCVEVLNLPLAWVRLVDGRRTLLDLTGYDICEVKPELQQAVQDHVQRGGATPTAFDDLAERHNKLADAVGAALKDIHADVQKALQPRPEPKPVPFWRVLLVFLLWVLAAFAATRALEAIWSPSPAPAKPKPSTHELHLLA